MKRQTRLVVKNNTMERKRVIDEDDDHDDKRLKICHSVKKNVNPLNENEYAVEDEDDDSYPPYAVQFFEVQTSTPVSQNGVVKTADQVTNEIKATFSPTSPINAANTSSGSDSDNTKVRGSLFISPNQESCNTKNMEANDVNILQNESFQEKVNNEKNIQINTKRQSTENNDIEVTALENKAVDSEAPPPEQPAVSHNNSWQYDSDNFLNSFLQVSNLKGHADSVNSVVVDGDIILSASSDTTIKMWDSTTKEEIRNFQGHTNNVTALVLLTSKQSSSLATKLNFPDNSRILISSSLDCSIRLWDISSGVELLSIYTYNGITCLAYLDEAHLVVLGTDGGKLEIWNILTSNVKHSIFAHQEAITCLKIDGYYAYTSSTDGLVKVWELEDEDDECNAIYTRRRMQRSRNHGKLEPTSWRCLDFLNSQIYLGDDTPYVKLLNWKEGHIQELRTKIQLSDITEAVCIKEDILITSYFDAASKSGGLNVWRLPEMKYICTISGKLSRILCLAMTVTEDKILRIITGGTELLIWDFISDNPSNKEKGSEYFCRNLKTLGLSLEEKGSAEESSGSSVSLASATKGDDKKKFRPWCIVM